MNWPDFETGFILIVVNLKDLMPCPGGFFFKIIINKYAISFLVQSHFINKKNMVNFYINNIFSELWALASLTVLFVSFPACCMDYKVSFIRII